MAFAKTMRSFRGSNVIQLVAVFLVSFACPHSPVISDDWHLDAASGDDTADGQRQPVKTIAAAIRRAKPRDTIHLRPVTYRDWAAFFDKSGEPGKTITLDGHGRHSMVASRSIPRLGPKSNRDCFVTTICCR